MVPVIYGLLMTGSRPARMSPSATLARRFQQNWLAQYPQDTSQDNGVNLDDSLTSLGWLQNLKVSEITHSIHTVSPSCLQDNRQFTKQEPPDSPPPTLPLQLPNLELCFELGDVMTPSCGPSKTDYKRNPYVKPPFSYAKLICMAMSTTKANKITLASIYSWIAENFMYYRHTDPSWQNSIRHNLSLNKCFEKVARQKDEPGKGGFWRISPEYRNLAENGVFKKRQGSHEFIPSPPFKRFRFDDDDIPYISGMKSGAREDKLLSTGSFTDSGNDDDSSSLILKGNFNWTPILKRDIDIGGKIMKTEDILDETESSPFMAMSPPSLETNSDDFGLDELFSQADFSVDLPQTKDPLDLTVQGIPIRPPDWWTGDVVNLDTNQNKSSGLNTPVPPELDHVKSMWEQGLNFSSSGNFVLDNLFDIERIPSPQM